MATSARVSPSREGCSGSGGASCSHHGSARPGLTDGLGAPLTMKPCAAVTPRATRYVVLGRARTLRQLRVRALPASSYPIRPGRPAGEASARTELELVPRLAQRLAEHLHDAVELRLARHERRRDL